MDNHFEVRWSLCCSPTMCTDCPDLYSKHGPVPGYQRSLSCVAVDPSPSPLINFSLVENREGLLENEATLLGGIPLFGASPYPHLLSSSR